jgi:hypothetical protein
VSRVAKSSESRALRSLAVVMAVEMPQVEVAIRVVKVKCLATASTVEGKGKTRTVWGKASKKLREKGGRESQLSTVDGSTVEWKAK